MGLRDNVVLCLALAFSIVLHLLILPVVYKKNQPMAYAPPAKSTHLDTIEIEKHKIELGINASNEATLTWIGYKEYEEQRARFAEVEQAAMQAEVELSVPTPMVISATTLQQLSQPIADMAAKFLKALQGIEIAFPSKEIALDTRNVSSQSATYEETHVTPSPKSAEVIEEKIPFTGNPSDRDSEATSIIHISQDQWKSGKPLAAHGIVLRPRRPSFTANQLVTNAPSALVAELHINNRGKPQDVVILFSTGSQSIDRSLEASLFRWRASGNQIDSLEDEKTLIITIHISFSK